MIVAIANHKGGVGKTSVAVHLGAILAIKGLSGLVIDNDPQANSSTQLMIDGYRVEKCLYELLDPTETPPPVADCIYPSKHENLDVLPNVEATSGLELEFSARYPDSLLYMRRAIRDYAIKNYQFTLIDCPPTLSVFVGNALHAADAVIVPVTTGSKSSLNGLQNVLNLIKSIQENGNPDLRFLRMLINRVDRRTSVAKAVMADIRGRFGDEHVFKNEIPINTAIEAAEYENTTIFKSSPSCRAAAAYRKLATEMIAILKEYK